jgi:hypothetical protein
MNSSIGNAHEREQLGVLTGFLSLFVVRACLFTGIKTGFFPGQYATLALIPHQRQP